MPASEAQAHYLNSVMRRKAGDLVTIFNGSDGEWLARIFEPSRKTVGFELLSQARPQQAEPDCWLCFALLKRQKTDLVVEKATELGVSVIQPIVTERTQADHVNLERLRAIAIEAAEQCERLVVPEIREPMRLPAIAGRLAERAAVVHRRRTPHRQTRQPRCRCIAAHRADDRAGGRLDLGGA